MSSNQERIDRGAELLDEYNKNPGMDPDSPHDAITDILHAIHAQGGDTEAAIRMAVANFEEERDEEEGDGSLDEPEHRYTDIDNG